MRRPGGADPAAKVAGLLHVVLPGRRRVRRPGDRHAFYADTGVAPAGGRDDRIRGASRDRLQATVVGGAMGSPPGNFGDLGRLNVEAVTVRLQERGIPMVIREVLGQMGRRISLDVATGLVRVDPFSTMPGILPGQAELAPKQLTRLAREVSRLRPEPRVSALAMEGVPPAPPGLVGDPGKHGGGTRGSLTPLSPAGQLAAIRPSPGNSLFGGGPESVGGQTTAAPYCGRTLDRPALGQFLEKLGAGPLPMVPA